MGLLAQHRPPELDSAFHTAVLSKVSVILMKRLTTSNKYLLVLYMVSLTGRRSVCQDIYPVLFALVLECLAITMTAIPEEPFDTADVSVKQRNAEIGGGRTVQAISLEQEAQGKIALQIRRESE